MLSPAVVVSHGWLSASLETPLPCPSPLLPRRLLPLLLGHAPATRSLLA
jgi:hypothetical protein